MASQERSATGNRSGVPCSSHCARLPLINPTLNNKYLIFYTEILDKGMNACRFGGYADTGQLIT